MLMGPILKKMKRITGDNEPIRTPATTKPTRTLHETVLKNFNRTPSGKIYEKDIKDIYSMMLLCLRLQESNGSKRRLNYFFKNHAFTFHVNDAVQALNDLTVSIDLSRVTTVISYSIKPELGTALVKKFFAAKLLHCPTDRTRSKPKQGVLLQPTPKGVALLEDFYRNIGGTREKVPEILLSTLNSMELFKFERDPITDKILYSDYLLQLFFKKLVGKYPNVWSPHDKPDKLPNIETKLDLNDNNDFCPRSADKVNINLQHILEGVAIETTSNDDNFSDSCNSRKFTTCDHNCHSPLHHRYFTNPDSDSHVQYYVSDSGIKFHRNKIFTNHNGEKVAIKYCISGKALCQWICDCTDILNISHAIKICDLLLTARYFSPITLYPSNAAIDRFAPSRDSFYILTKTGLDVLEWNIDSDVMERNPSYLLGNEEHQSQNAVYLPDVMGDLQEQSCKQNYDTSTMSLKESLKDPGTRYLFKKHLESEFCAENLEAYLQLKQFGKRMKVLDRLLSLKSLDNLETSKSLDIQINQLVDASLALVYKIYFTYFSSDAPFLLNVDYNLKKQISGILVKSENSANLREGERGSFPIEHSPAFSEFVDREDKLDSNSDLPASISLDENPFATPPPSLHSSACDPCKFGDELEIQFELSETHTYAENKGDLLYSSSNLSSVFGERLSRLLDLLLQISVLYNQASVDIFRLMEIDSFPKFLKSNMHDELWSQNS